MQDPRDPYQQPHQPGPSFRKGADTHAQAQAALGRGDDGGGPPRWLWAVGGVLALLLVVSLIGVGVFAVADRDGGDERATPVAAPAPAGTAQPDASAPQPDASAPQPDDSSAWKPSPEVKDARLYRAETADVDDERFGRRFELGLTGNGADERIVYIAGTGLRATDCEPGAEPVSDSGLIFLDDGPTRRSRDGEVMRAEFDGMTLTATPQAGGRVRATLDFTTGDSGPVCKGSVSFVASPVANDGQTMYAAIVAAGG